MEKIGIYGTGNIGACLATLCSGNGFETTVVGNSEAGLERCRNVMESNWDELIEKKKAAEKNKKAAIGLTSISNDPEDLRSCTFVFEAVAEKSEIKEKVYENIEKVTKEDTIVASTTSSMTATELVSLLKVKSRFMIAHPFQPAHIQPLVEVVETDFTIDTVKKRTVKLLEGLDRQVVILKKDIPGFIINRLAQTMFRESLDMIEHGIATPEDIDKAVKWAIGKRYASIGLLEYYDFVGFELEKSIAENIYPTLCETKHSQEINNEGLKNKKTGYLAGEGLYDWREKDKEEFRKRRTDPFIEALNWTLPE
ncbi:MAG: 3-hydroxyacyl-CoA dehydrogenase family protein [Eubacteriales bacterium]